MSKVIIVIPAYNEEERLGKTLNLYLDFFSKYQDQVSLLVVPNGCRDQTAAVARTWQEKYPELVEIYEIKEAVGKGGAIIAGFQQALANCEWLGFVDADGATRPKEFAKIIEAAKKHDGAIAARWRKDSVVIGRNSLMRKMASKTFVILNRLILGLKYSDTQCGAKVFSQKALVDILPNLNVTDMAIDIQILYLLKKMGYNIIEIPTVWTEIAGSAALGNKTKFIKQSWRMFTQIFKIKFKKI